MQITTIGLDIAKNVFQVHGIDAAEKVVVRKQLRRSQVLAFFKGLPACLVGMEACATAHYWARELMKLGHQVRLMPAKDVKAYVKRNKNDAADAEAICEAVRRPTMRFVQVKSAEQQGRLMLHRARDLLMRQRTRVINVLRAHLAELAFTNCRGDDDIDAKRSRPSIGKPANGPARIERALLVGADQRITSGPAATAAASHGGKPLSENRPYTWLHPNASQKVRFCPCIAGAVHTWPVCDLPECRREVGFRARSELVLLTRSLSRS
jgi:transposase